MINRRRETGAAIRQLIARGSARVWHPDAPPQASPLFEVEVASGVRVTRGDSRYLIDGMSSWMTGIHRYPHPQTEADVRKQRERTLHVMFGRLLVNPRPGSASG